MRKMFVVVGVLSVVGMIGRWVSPTPVARVQASPTVVRPAAQVVKAAPSAPVKKAGPVKTSWTVAHHKFEFEAVQPGVDAFFVTPPLPNDLDVAITMERIVLAQGYDVEDAADVKAFPHAGFTRFITRQGQFDVTAMRDATGIVAFSVKR